ncbi:MAG TPA: hypothetical protein EYN66_15805 [Myxococcales bacterium]|nr:hypothetical protein [Myxococcales bacterium]
MNLDLELTPALLREGMVREVSRKVNALRKKAGLSIEDRIDLKMWSAEAEVKKMFEEHEEAFVIRVGKDASICGHPMWRHDERYLSEVQVELKIDLEADGYNVVYSDVYQLIREPQEVYRRLIDTAG